MQPRDLDGRKKLKECENALRKQRFEEAITTPEIAMASFNTYSKMVTVSLLNVKQLCNPTG